MTVVTAESCAAGLIAAALSYGPGASDCLHGGYIVYSKQQKTIALDIPASLLQQRGSVNADVAEQMATVLPRWALQPSGLRPLMEPLGGCTSRMSRAARHAPRVALATKSIRC